MNEGPDRPAETPGAPRPEEAPKGGRGRWRDLAFYLVLVLIILLFITGCVGSGAVSGSSMFPTLRDDDRFFFVRGFDYDYGDIIIFQSYSGDIYVKRLIAKAGDTVAIADGVTYRNGEALDEPYIAEPPRVDMPELTVPTGCFFAMGDNRNRSTDCRYFGPMDVSRIKGRLVLVVPLPAIYEKLTGKPAPELPTLRERMQRLFSGERAAAPASDSDLAPAN